jgi:hypothetical protein
MSWVRIDDHFYDHPKWATAPGDSIALWLAAMAWCNRAESFDGYIPAIKLRGLVNIRNPKVSAADLVKREAFTPHLDGYLICNYAEWQQNEKVKAIRQKRSESGKKGAAVRWGSMANDMASAIATDWQSDSNENAPPPTTHLEQVDIQLDDSTTPDPTVVGRVFAIYAEFVYKSNPEACRGDVDRYQAGIARKAQTERGEQVERYMRRNPTMSARQVAAQVLRVPLPADTHPVQPFYYYDPECHEHGLDGIANFAPEGAPPAYGPCPCRRSEPYPEKLATVTELHGRTSA